MKVALMHCYIEVGFVTVITAYRRNNSSTFGGYWPGSYWPGDYWPRTG